jgi:hypothetical protein
MNAEQQERTDESASDSLAGVGTLVSLQPFWPEGYLCFTSGTGL